MKLVMAIVSSDDSAKVSAGLTREGFYATKLATTGGLLMAGNTTFIIGTDDDKVSDVLEVIKKHSKKRTQMLPSSTNYGIGGCSTFPVEVTVGGATVFVLNVDQFAKL